MSYEAVKAYFEKEGLGERVVVREQISDTVAHAAEAVGCEPKQIAKTMSFAVSGEPVLVVMAGDARIDNRKFKDTFHQKPIMLPFEEAEEKIGHAPGGICPFAVNEGVTVYLDVSLQRFDVVYAAAGSINSTVELSPAELEKYAASQDWIRISKGWEEE